MCAESAVEPTRSENITVTWRRSARSSGVALGGEDTASPEGSFAVASVRKAAMAKEFAAVSDDTDAQVLQVLRR